MKVGDLVKFKCEDFDKYCVGIIIAGINDPLVRRLEKNEYFVKILYDTKEPVLDSYNGANMIFKRRELIKL